MKITRNYSILCVTLHLIVFIRLVEKDDPNAVRHDKLNKGKISLLIAHRSNLKDVKRIISTQFESEKEELVKLGNKCNDYYFKLPKNLRDPNDPVFRLARVLRAMNRRKSRSSSALV